MKRHWTLIVLPLVVVLMLGLSTGLMSAQGPVGNVPPPPRAHPEANVAGQIPIQGRLTDSAGNPLDGTYSVTFRLYDVVSGGTALCEQTQTLSVAAGLFNTTLPNSCGGAVDGAQLYLGVQVESDAEMTPRQPIYPVPYAKSLYPGARVIGSVPAGYGLYVENQGGWGAALAGFATYTTSYNWGVYGQSASPDGIGGYFENTADGVAVKAGGSGIIQSSAVSSLWISGSGLRPYRQADTTIIDMDTVGGAIVSPGATVSNKNVMLPIAITGPLYGQDVTVSGIDIYWVGSTDFDGISAILLRRQTGVCSTSSCYATILYDPTDQVCTIDNNPTGCTLHFNLTQNNVITSDSGILYLTLELAFGGTTGWVEVGGVRLTLLHE